jgi:hypothetical protein
MSYALGVRIESVSIIAADHPSGFTSSGGVTPAEFSDESKESARKEVLIYLAGPEAEKLYTGKLPKVVRLLFDDESQAAINAKYALGNFDKDASRAESRAFYDTINAYIEWQRLAARRMIKRLRPAVTALAKELLKRKQLSGEEAWEIIESSII